MDMDMGTLGLCSALLEVPFDVLLPFRFHFHFHLPTHDTPTKFNWAWWLCSALFYGECHDNAT
jgi:hypothetical protein